MYVFIGVKRLCLLQTNADNLEEQKNVAHNAFKMLEFFKLVFSLMSVYYPWPSLSANVLEDAAEIVVEDACCCNTISTLLHTAHFNSL